MEELILLRKPIIVRGKKYAPHKPFRAYKWQTYQHDNEHTGYQSKPANRLYFVSGYSALVCLTLDLGFKWSRALAEKSQSTPVIDENGYIYVATGVSEGDYCTLKKIAPDSNVVRTENLIGDRATNPYLHPNGLVLIYTNFGWLFCFDLELNKKWQIQLADVYEYTFYHNIVVDEYGNIYCPTPQGKLFILNTNGDIIKEVDIGIDPFSIAYDSQRGVLYIVGKGYTDWSKFFALDKSLNELWSIEFGQQVNGGVSIASDGTIYLAGCSTKKLWSINPKGYINWSYETEDWVWGQPAIHPNDYVLFASFDGYLYCLDKYGQLKWKIEATGNQPYAPAIDPNGYIYAVSYDLYYVRKIDINGNIIKTFKESYKINSAFAIG